MRDTFRFTAPLLLLIVAAGCCRDIAPPQFFHPGPVEYQQKRAERFDPYPDLMSGHELDDARPREFQRPMSDVKHTQTNPFAEQQIRGF